MKYPRLDIQLNRARKLTDEDISKIKMLYARGESRFVLAEKYRVSPATIYYHIRPRTQELNKISFKARYERIKNDPEYKKSKKKGCLESRKYRKSVSPEYRQWLASEAKRKYWKNKTLSTNG